ncbi:hypothetical protein BDM02DRAFT_3271429 [Thelephora ganbajun]|uniref:Uncharacterized protein n=1 Tax=Thelephora ganbajun TaxID=370292 RepID=A0ACB6Z8Y0_THEGA|nr:hypothetical protein BDM02DRAFT_3271429 [Thelephora ganbajun]
MSDMDVSDLKLDEISLTSTYEPEKMSDFNQGLCFDGARLVQQPLFDQDAQLVPPWKAPFVFREGALVVVEAHLNVFHFMADPKPNHLYQIAASRIKLLAPSPLAYKPMRPLPTQRKPLASRSSMFNTLLDANGGAVNTNANHANA